MATWAEFEADATAVADFASRLWPGVMALDSNPPVASGATSFAVAYLATVGQTVRRDFIRSARSSPAAGCSRLSLRHRRRETTCGEIPDA